MFLCSLIILQCTKLCIKAVCWDFLLRIKIQIKAIFCFYISKPRFYFKQYKDMIVRKSTVILFSALLKQYYPTEYRPLKETQICFLFFNIENTNRLSRHLFLYNLFINHLGRSVDNVHDRF